jgi:hypothetical protein
MTRPRPTPSGRCSRGSLETSRSHDSLETNHVRETHSCLVRDLPQSRLARDQHLAGDAVPTRSTPTSDGRRSFDLPETNLGWQTQSWFARAWSQLTQGRLSDYPVRPRLTQVWPNLTKLL